MRGGTGEPLSDKRSLRLVIDLMAIPGLSGEEQQVADFIQQTLVDAGADPNHIRTDSANRRTLPEIGSASCGERV